VFFGFIGSFSKVLASPGLVSLVCVQMVEFEKSRCHAAGTQEERRSLCRRQIGLLPRYDLTQQVGKSSQPPIATAYTGGSVQHGLSAAGGVDGFYKHVSAADKR
jgi:hypothetical protein